VQYQQVVAFLVFENVTTSSMTTFDDDDEDTGGESSNSMVDTNFKIPVVF